MKKSIFLFLVIAIFAGIYSFVGASELKKVEFKKDVVCTKIYAPVIWTDGKEYSNACMAEAAGALVKEEQKTFACTLIYMPVVWTDGKTYSNSCMAKAAGAWDDSDTKTLNSHLDFSVALPGPIIDKKIFLEKYGKICKTASDSVNTLFVNNGEFVGSTRIWVPENFKPSYTCIAYNDLVLTNEEKDLFNLAYNWLTLNDIKIINTFLKNNFAYEKDVFKNVENAQKFVKAIDKKLSEVSKSQKNNDETWRIRNVLNYLKYQIKDLFSEE